MSKARIILALLLVVVHLSACDPDKYAGQRPRDYPNTRWVCKDYPLEFSIDADHKMVSTRIAVNGETTFAIGGPLNSKLLTMTITIGDERIGLNGMCTFGPDEFVMVLDDALDFTPGENAVTHYFGENPVTLVFERLNAFRMTEQSQLPYLQLSR